MILKRKQEPVKEYKKTEQVYKEPVKVDWNKQKVCMDCQIPYGKYAGMTVEYVMENDERYYTWILNNVIGDWGLVVDKIEPVKKFNKPVGSVYSYRDMAYWIELIVVENVTGIVCNPEWLNK